MTLPALTMPATVPDWHATGYSQVLGGPFASVGVMTGAPRLRRVGVGAVHVVEAQMYCSAEQALDLQAWIEDDLEAGTLPFAARVMADDGTRVWWHARLVGLPDWQAVATTGLPSWQVLVSLRLEGEASEVAPS